ncbi:MAG TPA: isoleucine--tRNA ligase [Halanaerobiales bacterium]|nr:isoleucine--tRNA ligase [Halanaerobiales bacterium]
MGYKESINLPDSDFPMRANLSERENDFQKFWEENNIYEKAIEQREGNENFILHDGPPYANGDIHIGHALNKILKDIVTRYKTMKGYYSPYVPGWDTHGLPIEHKVTKEMGDEAKDLSVKELRKKCEDYALKYVDRQKDQFKRLGVWGEWENPYITLNKDYEVKQIEVFGEMAKKGLFYKGQKPVHWCPSCQTALAEAEVEYKDVRSPSIYVKFPVKEKMTLGGVDLNPENSYILIWTTTPWTIPANLAITVNPDLNYRVVEVKGEKMVLAEELIEEVMSEVGIEDYKKLGETFKGAELDNKKASHPIADRDSLIILGEHATLDQGTGCVHTAPGHGHDDFVVGRENDLDVYAPMDNKGYFTEEEETGHFEGIYYDDANIKVTDLLKEKNLLLNLDFIDHRYPHCWRCKGGLIFRATDQWFASIDAIKENVLDEIHNVDWYPDWGEKRMANMVADRTDWCISRQKKWGVPIPIFYCDDCGESIINDETLSSVKDLFAKEGSGAWYEKKASEILPEGYSCPHCGGNHFSKEEDIMDVWFDSGSSHKAVLETRDNLDWPAQLYLEGTDQYRGWFNSSLLTGVATEGKAPYESVVTNGFIVDKKGNKMSKSVGNVVSPHEVIDQYGADILRLWVASSDFKNDVSVSDKIIKQNSEVYRRIRNTFRFILGNIGDFSKDEDYVPFAERHELDRWIMVRLKELTENATKAYKEYEYHRVYHDIHNFCTVEMSSLYADVIKDRLYTDGTDSLSRRAAQSTLYDMIVTLVKLVSPVLVHTAEEVWGYLEEEKEENESIFLTDWPEFSEEISDDLLLERWDQLLSIRKDVSKALELARENKDIGNSLEAKVILKARDEEQYKFLKDNFEQLADLFIVSQVELVDVIDDDCHIGSETEIRVLVKEAEGEKCERCWKYSTTVGDDHKYEDVCERCATVLHEQE